MGGRRNAKGKKPLIYVAQHGAAVIRHSQISNATRGTDLGEVVPEVHLSQHPFPQDYGTVFSAACQGDHAFGDSSNAIDIAVMPFWLKAASRKKGMRVATALSDRRTVQNRRLV